MKRILCLSLFAALTLTGGAAFAADACTKIIATGHPQYPPIAFRSGENIVGAAPALVETIAKGLNIPLESKFTGTWAEAQEAARDGKADLIFGIYYNDERATYLDYVEPPFMYDPVGVLVAKGKGFTFTGQDDLIGKKGVTNKGESYGQAFDTFINDKLTVARSDGLDAAFEDLLSGKADYVLVGLHPGVSQATKLGIKDKIEVLQPPLLSSEMYVAFSKKSPCRSLAADFGKGITALTTDGSFNKMLTDAAATWEGAQQAKK